MQVLLVLNCRVSKDGKEKLTTASEASGMLRQQLNIPIQNVDLRLKHQMRSTGLLMTQDPIENTVTITTQRICLWHIGLNVYIETCPSKVNNCTLSYRR